MTAGGSPPGDEALPRDGARWERHPATLGRLLPDGWLLAGPEGDPVHLPGAASEVWNLLAHPLAESEVADALVERYRLGRDEVAPAVRRTLRDLDAVGIVRHARPGPEG
jgi:hypothetical protein